MSAPRVYQQPWLTVIRLWLPFVIFLPLPVICGAFALKNELPKLGLLALVFMILALVILVPQAFGLWSLARRVVITEEGLQATTHVARRISFRWGDVIELHEWKIQVDRYGIDPKIGIVVLVPRSGPNVAIDGRLRGFTEVSEAIAAHTRSAKRMGDVRPWWDRHMGRL
jgi:hypothetical protein